MLNISYLHVTAAITQGTKHVSLNQEHACSCFQSTRALGPSSQILPFLYSHQEWVTQCTVESIAKRAALTQFPRQSGQRLSVPFPICIFLKNTYRSEYIHIHNFANLETPENCRGIPYNTLLHETANLLIFSIPKLMTTRWWQSLVKFWLSSASSGIR